MVFNFCRTTGSGSVSRMVLPYDFDILRPSVPGNLAAGVSSGCGSGKRSITFAVVKLIEPPRDFPRQLHVRYLVFAHRNEITFVHQDVGRLQHGIAEKSVGAQVFFLDVLLLVLVGRHALQPAQRRDHGKQQVQFRMLRHVRLDEHGAALGIQPGGQPIQQNFEEFSLTFEVSA